MACAPIRACPARCASSIDRADKLPLSVQTYVGPAGFDAARRDGSRPRRGAGRRRLSAVARGKVDGRAGRDALIPGDARRQRQHRRARSSRSPRTRRFRARRAAARCRTWAARPTACRRFPRASPSRFSPSPATRRDNQSVRQQALSVLGRLDHGAGIPPLIQLSQQTQSNWLAKESMSDARRSGDPRARQYLRTAVQAHRSARRSADGRAARARPGLRDGAGRRAASRGLPDAQERPLARSRVQRARRDGRRRRTRSGCSTLAQNGNEPIHDAPPRARRREPCRRADRRSDQALRHDDGSEHEGDADRRSTSGTASARRSTSCSRS